MRAGVLLLVLLGFARTTVAARRLAAVCVEGNNPVSDPFYQTQCLKNRGSACTCPNGADKCTLGSTANRYCKQECSADKENFTCVRNRISVCDCPAGSTCTAVSAGFSTCRFVVCPANVFLPGNCAGGPEAGQVCECPLGAMCADLGVAGGYMCISGGNSTNMTQIINSTVP